MFDRTIPRCLRFVITGTLVLAAAGARAHGGRPSTPGDRTPVVVDTDMGLDDVAAILAVAAAPTVAIEAVTTVGGAARARVGAENAARLLTFIGMPAVPVAPGGWWSSGRRRGVHIISPMRLDLRHRLGHLVLDGQVVDRPPMYVHGASRWSVSLSSNKARGCRDRPGPVTGRCASLHHRAARLDALTLAGSLAYSSPAFRPAAIGGRARKAAFCSALATRRAAVR